VQTSRAYSIVRGRAALGRHRRPQLLLLRRQWLQPVEPRRCEGPVGTVAHAVAELGRPAAMVGRQGQQVIRGKRERAAGRVGRRLMNQLTAPAAPGCWAGFSTSARFGTRTRCLSYTKIFHFFVNCFSSSVNAGLSDE
jgi:hypothetical protein